MLRFISNRIRKGQKGSFSATVSMITVTSVAFGMVVLILSVFILEGFKANVLTQLFSAEGHIKVSSYDANTYSEESPIKQSSEFYHHATEIDGLSHIQSFANKSGLIKTESAVEGVLVKGVGVDFNRSIFEKNIQKGTFLNVNDSNYVKEIVLSETIATKLKLSVGDDLYLFFIQDKPKERKLKVVGIYNTFIGEFDSKVVLCDIKMIQKLNHWSDTLIGGYDVFLTNLDHLPKVSEAVYDQMDYDLQLEKITARFPHIFDWLTLLNKNVVVFVIIIFVIAAFNMLSTMYILMMERANMIGMFKAMGAMPILIRKVFWYYGLSLGFKGIVIGNVIALLLCAVQYYFRLFPLDPESYYMDAVPILWDWSAWVMINVLVSVLIALIVFFPTYLITRMNALKVIKFD
ncbi:MAG: ABC transporter permease [Cyclobacteriaceae bacterium]